MENVTVHMPIERYNELIEIEKNLKEGKILCLKQDIYNNGFGDKYNTERHWYTGSEMIKNLTYEIDCLSQKLKKLQDLKK